MNALVQHFSFEFNVALRNKNSLLLTYLMPLGFYFMVSSFMTGINPFFKDIMIPGMLMFGALSGTILGLPNNLVEAREGDILRSYKINGVPATSILFVPAVSTSLHLLLVGLVITITAPFIFKAPLPVNLPVLVLCYLVTLAAFTGLGLLIGVVSANTQMTVLWSQLIYLPSMLVGGVMVPADALPPALQRIGMLLPSSHASNAFLGLAMGYETPFSPWLSLLALLAGAIAAYALALFLFSWDSRNTSRRGHPVLTFLALLPYVVTALLLPW